MAENEKIEIVGGRKEQAAEIASLIMEAMDYDCCQNFAGEAHTLQDFHRKRQTVLVSTGISKACFNFFTFEGHDYTSPLTCLRLPARK